MELLDIEYLEEILVIRLDNGDTNPLSPQLLSELIRTVSEAKDDNEVTALMLASSNDKFFSIGLDIPTLYGLPREEFRSFYRGFNKLCIDLYTLSKPTVAAITGHAIAGGCILALCCDRRVIAEGRKLMGLNEIKLGVPVPYPGDRILNHEAGTRCAREVIDTGEFFEPDDSLRLGMVDQIFPIDRVLPEAMEWLRSMAELPRDAFSMIKRNRVEPVMEQLRAGLMKREGLFVERWYSEEVRKRLKGALKTF